jgi:hypothetical protein
MLACRLLNGSCMGVWCVWVFGVYVMCGWLDVARSLSEESSTRPIEGTWTKHQRLSQYSFR